MLVWTRPVFCSDLQTLIADFICRVRKVQIYNIYIYYLYHMCMYPCILNEYIQYMHTIKKKGQKAYPWFLELKKYSVCTHL